MEEDKIDQPVTEPEVATEGGEPAVEESVTEKSVKDILGAELGKEFSSDEEALKAVAGLKSLVGDQKVAEDRKKAEELAELKKDPNYAKITAELETIKLQQKHPEASEYLGEIQAIADAKGVSYNEAYETSGFGKLVEAGREKAQERQDKIDAIPGTNAAVSSSTNEEWQAAQKAFDEGDHGKLIRMKLPNVFGDT